MRAGANVIAAWLVAILSFGGPAAVSPAHSGADAVRRSSAAVLAAPVVTVTQALVGSDRQPSTRVNAARRQSRDSVGAWLEPVPPRDVHALRPAGDCTCFSQARLLQCRRLDAPGRAPPDFLV